MHGYGGSEGSVAQPIPHATGSNGREADADPRRILGNQQQGGNAVEMAL